MRTLDKYDLLNKHILDWKDSKFTYAKYDCLYFTSSYYEKLTGIDYGFKFKKMYKSKTGYFKMLKKITTIEEEVSTLFKIKNLSFYKRCDLVVYKGALGLCNGIYSLFLSEKGLINIKTLDCNYCWECP